MSQSPFVILPSSEPKRQEKAEAHFEKIWKRDPKKYDPLQTAIGRERIEKSWNLLTSFLSLEGKRVVDLGCGNGTFSRKLRDAGASIDAVDIASGALEQFRAIDATKINLIQDYVPETSLESGAYDLVVALDLIGELNPKEYRLFFQELHRLVHPDGWVLVSTPLDSSSTDTIETFSQLAQTELEIHHWVYSYHLWTERWEQRLSLPERYVKASQDPSFLQQMQEGQSPFGKKWTRWQSARPLVWGWWLLQGVCYPLLSLLRNSDGTVRALESACRQVKDVRGITHLLCLAKRKPLAPHLPADQIPQERPKKKQVWE